MVWAIPRRDPIMPYFLFEDQPLKNKGYLPKPSSTSIRTTLSSKLIWFDAKGYRCHKSIANKIETTGEPKKTATLLAKGKVISFKNSFTASLMGCNRPPSETFQGPLRYCENPRILRSIKVIKATLTSTQTNTKI